MAEPVQRVDELDVGGEGLRGRWRRAPRWGRALLALLLAAVAVGLAARTLAVQLGERAERRTAAERAAVADLQARLLTARARGPGGTRELRFLATNAGPLPVAVVGGDLVLAGAGRLDVAVQPLTLEPGATGVLRVRAARPDCPTPGPAAAPSRRDDALVLQVRTADGQVRATPLVLGDAVWSQLARAVPCSPPR